MVWVDIAIIFLLSMFMLSGIIRGYSQELYSLVVWMVGIVIGWFFSLEFSLLLAKIFSPISIRLVSSFAGLIMITLTTGWIVKLLLGGKSSLTFIDRLGGLLFGLAHGLIVVLVLVVIAGLTPLPKDRWWHESKHIPPFQKVVMFLKKNSSTKLASSINYLYNPK